MAANIILNPIFEAGFRDCSFGYRPKRNTNQALERIRVIANKGYNFVVDADIKDYFNTVNHDLVLALVSHRISDRRVFKLIRMWMRCGVIEDGSYQETEVGIPQGGMISSSNA